VAGVPAPATLAAPPAPARESVRPAARPGPLLLPPSTRVRVYGNRLGKVSLSLPSGRPGGVVEVARDRSFRRPIFSGPARSPFVTVAAPARGDLYWRLAGRQELAGHARFLPDETQARSPRHHLHNLVSEGRRSTTIYFQGPPPALTLSFAESSGAQGYRVRLFPAGAPGRPVLERVVEQPECPVGAGLLGEGRYEWTVEALDEGGRSLGGRPANQLELAYDNARSTLAILEPGPDRVLSGEAVTVRGVAPLGARLYVNGARAQMDEKGRFSLQVGGAPRVLVFRLVGSDGGESFWTRGVKPRS
jgi:hypothetical protein